MQMEREDFKNQSVVVNLKDTEVRSKAQVCNSAEGKH